MRLLSLAAAALAALLLTIALASAQQPPESQNGTRLEPGLNLVGWVGEPASVSQLFHEIPQLESVWAWDAELDDWIVAGRNAPEWLGGLGRVTAGMGLRLVLGGEEPFLWQRPTEPTRGLVKLRTGWNLVAWSGANGAPIEQVAKGIGWSLRELRRWNAANQQWTAWTSPERSTQLIATNAADQGATDEETKPPTVRRGEALWVNTARSVNWLQPTDILPRLIFPGGASDQLQARVREDLEAVLAFHGQQYGIQADPDFAVYIPKDVEALFQAYRDDGDEISDAWAAHIRALWNSVRGWAGGEIVLAQTWWPENLSAADIALARYTLTHEYFHILQGQLSDNQASLWLVEGTATWAEDDHQVIDGSNTQEDARERMVSAITEDTPSLRSTETGNATWQYTLGWLATDRLTAVAGDESYIEFWRRLASTEIGSHHRWTSRPDWRTAFQETFGAPASSFYTEFDVWQQEQAAANGATASSLPEGDARWIRGRVIDASGAPVNGVFVNAIRVEGGTSVGWRQRAETRADGAFAVRAPQDGDYRFSVDIADSCTRYYSDGELIDDWEKAQAVAVDGSDVRGVNIQLPPNICGWQIRGQAVSTSGELLAGVSVNACPLGGGGCTWSDWTTLNGSFATSAPAVGEYYLLLDLGCLIFHRSKGGAVLNRGHATPILIVDSDVIDLRLQVPSELCNQRVIGSIGGIERFLGASGTNFVTLCPIDDSGCGEVTSRRLDHNGLFAVAIPTAGSYRLSYSLDGCTLHYSPTGLTGNAAEAMRFDAGDRDVRLGHRQIPDDMCAYQIVGSVTKADGAPLADTYINACREVDDQCVEWAGRNTNADGTFAITVPTVGRYRVSLRLEGCTIYFRAGGFTTSYSERSTARVEGRDARLNPRQIPEGMCAHRISGHFVDANGAALVDKWVSACRASDDCVATWTAADGRFTIRVPSDDSYAIDVWLADDCHHRLEGQALGSADNPVWVSGGDVTGVELRLPGTVEELCG